MGLKTAICAVAGALVLTAPAAAQGLKTSLVPGYPDVVGEYLQVAGGQAPGTPAGLNTATFLRLRAAADGERPRPAHAVVVSLPGFSSTPAHWLYLGSQLVSRAQRQRCEGGPCRVEVWVLQRRGANLADTSGLIAARKAGRVKPAMDYYFGAPQTAAWTGKGAPARIVGPGPDARWKPLTPADLSFMADWGFETYAGDVDAMIGQIRQASGNRNIFLAGHSQGGGFVANYAARMKADGRRGVADLAGLIFLDGGPSAGQPATATDSELKAYFDRVAALRAGRAKVYTDASGMLGAIAGPASAMSQSVTGLYYAFESPRAEAIFPLRVAGMAPGPGDDFLKVARMTWLARAGTSFDTDPVPGGGVQMPVLRFLGEGLGALDFAPRPGTEGLCDKTPEPAMLGPPRPASAKPACTPSGAMVDPDRVYDWVEGGGGGGVPTDVGKAALWMASQAWAPARTNVRPVRVTLTQTGPVTLDAGSMVGSNWYASERWDFDAGFVGRYRTLKLDRDGVRLDIDKTAIAGVPVYVARQSPQAGMTNPFPGVADFTEVNKTGTWQTDAARAITPFDPSINAALYFHTDFVSADDSTPGRVKPGQPGHSAVAATLTEWILKRSRGAAVTPTPKTLGVRAIF